MAQSQSGARLDVAFSFEGDEGVRDQLRNLMAALEARFQAVEVLQEDAETQAQTLVNVGLKRINDVLLPSVLRIQKLTSLGFLVAESASGVKLELGQKGFTLVEGTQRDLFTPSAYVGIERKSDYNTRAIAKVLSYDNTVGFLSVQILAFFGSQGPFGDWVISASPGVTEATRFNMDQAAASMVAAQAARTAADADAAATAADRVQTGADRAQTTADRIQTALDRAAAATSASAAAASAASADSQNRVAKAGDTMSGFLSTPGIFLTKDPASQLVFQSRDDNRNFLAYNQANSLRLYNATDGGDIFRFGYVGDFWTAQIGDLKTYVDKAVAVPQTFSQAQKAQARANIGAGTLLAAQIGAAVSLTATALNRTHWISAGGYTIKLPSVTTVTAGDCIRFVSYTTGTVTVSSADSDANANIFSGTGFGKTIQLGAGQSAEFITDGNSWVVGFRGIMPERTLSTDAQTFTDAQKQQLLANADIVIPHGQCRLIYVSPTQIRLDPCNGNKIFINGNYRPIPAGGVTLSNAGMSAGTLYYIQASWNGSAIVLSFSATPPVIDPVYGNKVWGGGGSDAANRLYALVGAVSTVAGAQFRDDYNYRGVASYYNRRNVYFGGAVTGGSGVNVASGTFVNLGTISYAFTWSDEATIMHAAADAANTNQGWTCSVSNSADGTVYGLDGSAHTPFAGYLTNLNSAFAGLFTEGMHAFGVSGKVSGYSATMYVHQYGITRI